MITDFQAARIEDLVDFYHVAQSPWVRSNMVVSLDGHFVDAMGTSEGLSSDIDLRILLLLRALSDVVLVGGSTVRREGYDPKPIRPEFHVLRTDSTPVAIITNSLDFDFDSLLFSESPTRPIILTSDKARLDKPEVFERAQSIATVQTTETVTGHWVRDTLHDHGFSRVLSEGGPRIQELLLRDGALDELDVTVAPCIQASSHTIPAFGQFASQLELGALARGSDHTFARYFVKR